jgi:galactose mutarotase-like enzyme
MNRLENEKICIAVRERGAELTSIYHKGLQKEYLWQADPTYWGKHAPVLFPVIGALRDEQFIYEGKVFNLSKHGFARDLDFLLVEMGVDYLEYELEANEETMASYPFDFSLRIRYTLEEETVHTDYFVKNKGGEEMFYSLGAHPAFNWPLEPEEDFSDYHLRFAKQENLDRLMINIDTGLRNLERVNVVEESQILNLDHALFQEDALIFEGVESEWIRFESQKSDRFIQVSLTGFTHLGIWTKPNHAPFLCIEPWQGLCDRQDATKKIDQKEGIRTVGAGEANQVRLTIAIG